MSSARCTSLLTLLFAAGCLKPGPLPQGSKLASGRDIAGVSFVSIASDTDPNQKVPWVVFNRLKSLATPSKGAVSDLWLVGPVASDTASPWDGAQQRLVIANRSDRWDWTPAGGSFFTMVDEQQVTSGSSSGGQLESVGTLVRLDSQYQPNVSFENVSTFAPYSESRLLYCQVLPGDTPGLFLWDGQDSRRLGDVASVSLLDMQFGSGGMAYFVLGIDRVLSRLGNLTDTVQDLHANVTRFQLSGDEKYAALSLSDASTTKTVVLDIQSGKDIPLARPNPCCWLGLSGNAFTYVQSAMPGMPAEYHTLDLASGTDTTLVLPAPLVDLARTISRPQSDDVLYLDNQGHGVFFGPDQQPRRAVLQFGGDEPVRMLIPQFSRDGRYLLYLDPQPTTQADPYERGPLMVQDSDLLQPPRQLSTPGMTVYARDRPFFINGPTTDAGTTVLLVFWASIVRSSADLYFANYETGELQPAASSIGSVTVLDYNHIFGTINVSAQDAVGDLVLKDVQDNVGLTLAQAVTEFSQWNDLVAYVVRGRVSSDHDGLWGTIRDPPGQDGGQ